MSTTATIRLYEMLKPKLVDQEARMFIQHFEESFDERFAGKLDLLATKVDIAETRADIIKWMFIFWVGQIATVIAIMKLL